MSNHHFDMVDGYRVCTREGRIKPQERWLTRHLEQESDLNEIRENLGVEREPIKHEWDAWPVGVPVVRVTPTGSLLRSQSNPVPESWRYDPAAPGAIRASMRRSA